jgi:uncharacterized membrane protein YdjX (TVP38/TMEM64 family)
MADTLVQWLQGWGEMNAASAAALALVFVSSGLVLIPRTFLCLAAGALFGTPAISVIVPSTTVGGIAAFLLARYLLFSRLRRELARRPRLGAIANAVESESWRLLALLRFGSPVPTTVQNYLFGLTKIGLWPFTITTFLFSIPQIALYVYLGAAGRAALLDDRSSLLSRVLMGIGILTLATVVLLVARKCRLALRRVSELDQ